MRWVHRAARWGVAAAAAIAVVLATGSAWWHVGGAIAAGLALGGFIQAVVRFAGDAGG
jgi:hypothetical protein